MPFSSVVPSVIAPRPPCHSMVHPPHWRPMSSAAAPATSSRRTFGGIGRAASLFFSRTCDLLTASLATARWPSLPISGLNPVPPNGSAQRPSGDCLFGRGQMDAPERRFIGAQVALVELPAVGLLAVPPALNPLVAMCAAPRCPAVAHEMLRRGQNRSLASIQSADEGRP